MLLIQPPMWLIIVLLRPVAMIHLTAMSLRPESDKQFYIVPRTGVFTTCTGLNTGLQRGHPTAIPP